MEQVWLLPEELDQSYKRPAQTVLRPFNDWMESADAGKAGTQPSAHWEYGGLVMQICLLGDIAIGHKGQSLQFGPERRKIDQFQLGQCALRAKPRAGWALKVERPVV